MTGLGTAGLDAGRVQVRAGGKVLVDGVDLHVQPGVLTALVGPNGAGKSTLLRVLAGIERPDAGDVHFRGDDLFALRRRARARLAALVEQDAVTDLPLTVRATVALGRLPHESLLGGAESDDSGVDSPDDLDDSDEDSPDTSTPSAVPTATSGPDDGDDDDDRVDGTHAPRPTPAGTPAPRTDNSGPGSITSGSGGNSGSGDSGSGRDHPEDDDHTSAPTAGPTGATPSGSDGRNDSDDREYSDDSDDDSGHHSGSDHDDDDSSGHGSDHD